MKISVSSGSKGPRRPSEMWNNHGLGKMEITGDFDKRSLRAWQSLKPTDLGCGLCIERLKRRQQQEHTPSPKSFAEKKRETALLLEEDV